MLMQAARKLNRAVHRAKSAVKTQNIHDFPRKLHLGCGPRRADGYCNVDITPRDTVDITDDVSKLTLFPDNHATAIYACHVLEHFSHEECKQVLRNWFRVLAPGGEVRISVPDIDRIVKIYMKNWEHFQTEPHAPWIGLIYGGQTDQYDFHKTGFNFCWMRYLLKEIGFTDIAEYPHAPHFLGEDFYDASLAYEPFGEYLSLNVTARKPAANDR